MQQKKQQLRYAVASRLRAMSAKDRSAESRSCCRRIQEGLTGESFDAICAYVPLSSEVDIRPLLREFLRKHIPLYLPRVEQGKMVFRRVTDLTTLTKGTYGILEPPVSGEELQMSWHVMALIPGRAFDASGRRLGRGNGGYDHWIRSMREKRPKTKFWGIGFECQIVQEVPVEAHDEKVDAVVTARGSE